MAKEAITLFLGQRIEERGFRWHRKTACRADDPPSTASSTRRRRSLELGPLIFCPFVVWDEESSAPLLFGMKNRISTAVWESLNRHSPDDIQIRENRTTVPPPRELYSLCSHPMA